MYENHQLKDASPQRNFFSNLFGTIDCTRITKPCDHDGSWCNLPDRQQDQKKSYFRRKESEFSKIDSEKSDSIGVGIIFDCGPDGRGPRGDGLVVNSLVPNGAAELSAAQLSTGDKLLAIDGVDVLSMNARKISQLVLGPEDSVVTLRFESNTEPKAVFDVSITRRRARPRWTGGERVAQSHE